MIASIYSKITETTTLTTVQEISAEIMKRLTPAQYEDALTEALPKYVQHLMAAQRRVIPVPEIGVHELETFAEDDLLAPDVAEIAVEHKRALLKSRGSARVDAIRNEWQRHFKDRVWNGTRYMLFGDMTAVDLKGAADSLRDQAASYVGKAERYDAIAAALLDGGRVSDLVDDPTQG